MVKYQGFTLIELLVVIFIIAVVVAAASFTLGDNQAERLKHKSEQIIALIELAKEQAIFNTEELGLIFTNNSYEFYRLDIDNLKESLWVPIENDKLFKKRTLPDGLEFELFLEGTKVVFSQKEKEKITPQVFILSDGTVSPFQINIKDNISHSSQLKFMQNGDYDLVAVN